MDTARVLALPALKEMPRTAFATIDGVFLREHPRDAYRAGRQLPLPALLGSATGEQRSMLGEVHNLDEYQTRLAQRFGYDPAVLAQVRELYPANDDAQARTAVVVMATDGDVMARMRTWARYHASTSGAPVWLSAHNVPMGGDFALHGDDVSYWFCNVDKASPRRPPPRAAPEDVALCQQMLSAAVSFIRRGDPSSQALRWPRYTPQAEAMMWFDTPRTRVTSVSPGVKLMVEQAPKLFGWEF